MKKIFALFTAFLIATSFAACGKNEPADREDPKIPEISENTEVSEDPENKEPEKPIDLGRKEVDKENFPDATEIVLSANGITVDGEPAEKSDCVSVGGEIIYYHEMDFYESGNDYGAGGDEDKHTEEEVSSYTLVTITKPGEYFIRGEMKGQLAVDLGKEASENKNSKVTLILGGTDIRCEVAPAVIFYNVYECGDEEKPVSEVDTSTAGATVVVADGSVNNLDGAYVAKIYKDNPEKKKLHKYDAALYSKMSMNIEGGSEGTGILNVDAENEGIDTEMHLTFNGGNINITAKNDGINTNEDGVSVVTINGGNISIKAGTGTEGDGIDSNGWVVINGGKLFAEGNHRASDSGIDADKEIFINGGTVVSYGSQNDYISGKSKAPFAQIVFDSVMEEKSKIRFVDSEGKGIEIENEEEFYTLVVSGEDIVYNREYNLYVNDVMQEFSSDAAPIESLGEEFSDIAGKLFGGILNRIESGNKNSSGSSDKNGIQLEQIEEKDGTAFVITEQTYYFSGVYDSAKATGKTRVDFTVDGENRIDDIYKGDVPGIKSIECTEKIAPEDVRITVVYSGRNEEISLSRSCLLSEGYEAVNKLFEGLEEGSYRLTIKAESKNEKYMGITTFYFSVLE